MAQEITLTTKVVSSKGGVALSHDDTATKIDLASAIYSAGILATTTTHAAIPLGSVTTVGIMRVKNLDATNSIEIGRDDSGTFRGLVKLKPGEPYTFRSSVNAPYAKAMAGTASLQFTVWSD